MKKTIVVLLLTLAVCAAPAFAAAPETVRLYMPSDYELCSLTFTPDENEGGIYFILAKKKDENEFLSRAVYIEYDHLQWEIHTGYGKELRVVVL